MNAFHRGCREEGLLGVGVGMEGSHRQREEVPTDRGRRVPQIGRSFSQRKNAPTDREEASSDREKGPKTGGRVPQTGKRKFPQTGRFPQTERGFL